MNNARNTSLLLGFELRRRAVLTAGDVQAPDHARVFSYCALPGRLLADCCRGGLAKSALSGPFMRRWGSGLPLRFTPWLP